MDIKYHSPFNELVLKNGNDVLVLHESDIDKLLMVLGEARRDLYTELIGDTLGIGRYCVGDVKALSGAVGKVGLVVALKYLKCLDMWHRLDDDYKRRLNSDIIYLEMMLAGQITPLIADEKPVIETEEQLEEAIIEYIDKCEKIVFSVGNNCADAKVIDIVYVKESKILEAFEESAAAEIIFATLDKLVAEKRILECKHATNDKVLVDGECFISGSSIFQISCYKINRN